MYGFHCQLANFDAVDDFSKKLAPFRGDADQFCSQLCAIVDGAVDFKTAIPPACAVQTQLFRLLSTTYT